MVPNPGVYIYQPTGAMVGGGGGPTPFDPNQPPPTDGDPVELSTGLFVYQKTDEMAPDVLPIALHRVYRNNDNVSRAFGIGSTDNYDIYLTGDTFPYTYMELILTNGYRVRYERISSGTGYQDAVYTHTSAQDEFFASTIFWNNITNNSWILQLKDGTQLQFPDFYLNLNPRQAAVTGIADRYGNSVQLKGRKQYPKSDFESSDNGCEYYQHYRRNVKLILASVVS